MDARHLEELEQLVIPVACLDVVEHRAAGVGRIGDVDLAAGQFPDQPRIDRAEGELARLGVGPRALDVVENPPQLCCRKNRRRSPGRSSSDRSSRPSFFIWSQKPAVRRSCQTMAWPTGSPVSRFQTTAVSRWLVMPMAADIARVEPGLAHRLGRDAVLRGPDFVGIVLHPARLGKVLLEFLLRDGAGWSRHGRR